MTVSLETPRTSLLRKAALFVALAVLGGLAGYGISTLMGDVRTVWQDELAVLMAVMTISTGLISAFVVATRPSTVPRGCGVLQVIVMLLAGTLFLLPMFGTAVATPEVIFGAVVVLLVLQSVANLMLWRAADEMLRRVMSETSAMAFWALQLCLFVYAAAERLGLVDTVSGWGLMGILMGVYFVASIVAAARRGLH